MLGLGFVSSCPLAGLGILAMGLLGAGCGGGGGGGGAPPGVGAAVAFMTGIPSPTFGLTEAYTACVNATFDFGAGPEPYRNGANGPFTHYVDVVSGTATDASNPFGTPDKPRRSIPQNLPAGSVVEIHSGTYTALVTQVEWAGDASRPIFIRGIGMPRFSQGIEVVNTLGGSGGHVIIEGLSVFKFRLHQPYHHVALRHSEVRGDLSGGGAIVAGFTDPPVADCVLWKNQIHDNGDPQADFDQDIHGISVGARVNHLWILENELFRNSGDGVQINAGSLSLMPTTHHIFVGGNLARENKQTGFWTKQAVDVIFAGNESRTHYPVGTQPSAWGAGMGYQLGPERVWFLFNHIHDCAFGIQATSTSGGGNGTESFMIGNLIHDIHHHPGYPYDASDPFSNAGINMVGVPNKYVINNTIFDVDAGIYGPSTGRYVMANNIISNVTEADGNHIWVYESSAIAQSVIGNTVFFQNGSPARIRWDGATLYQVGTFQAAFPGNGLGCLTADPLFVDAGGGDFHLRAGSPAIDAGSVSGSIESVLDNFRQYYGVSIAVDIDGKMRPTGAAIDAGAFEK